MKHLLILLFLMGVCYADEVKRVDKDTVEITTCKTITVKIPTLKDELVDMQSLNTEMAIVEEFKETAPENIKGLILTLPIQETKPLEDRIAFYESIKIGDTAECTVCSE